MSDHDTQLDMTELNDTQPDDTQLDDTQLYEPGQPLFTAVSGSARPLHLLLRCIGFADKAQVQISEEGLRFSVEEASVMEGFAFLDRGLFANYQFHAPAQDREVPTHSRSPARSTDDDDTADDEDGNDGAPLPPFVISLPSLLETLQILGLSDVSGSGAFSATTVSRNPTAAFAAPALGLPSLCRLSYDAVGAPLTVALSEASIRTECALTTFEPDYTADIPFSRSELALKVIMRAGWLANAVTELGATGASTLVISASAVGRRTPYFALSAEGPLGSARVEFNYEAALSAGGAADATQQPSQTQSPPPTQTQTQAQTQTQMAQVPEFNSPALLETFLLPTASFRNAYKFGLIQRAARAMAVASKVSVRGDRQGVLSLQFMIEVEPGKVSFIDFRFVPLVEEDASEESQEDEDRGYSDH